MNTRTTPSRITSLAPGEIFVFGSNLAGRHGKGAALTAAKLFGAKRGVGHGFMGRCYAIPTKDSHLKPLSLAGILQVVDVFRQFASDYPSYTFLVTPIGCGEAGYDPEEIAPLFGEELTPNIVMPESFLPFVGWKQPAKKYATPRR